MNVAILNKMGRVAYLNSQFKTAVELGFSPQMMTTIRNELSTLHDEIILELNGVESMKPKQCAYLDAVHQSTCGQYDCDHPNNVHEKGASELDAPLSETINHTVIVTHQTQVVTIESPNGELNLPFALIRSIVRIIDPPN